MTHREARHKLGSRTTRRRNTNGKNMWDKPTGQSGRVSYKFLNPRPAKRTVAVKVKRLVHGL